MNWALQKLHLSLIRDWPLSCYTAGGNADPDSRICHCPQWLGQPPGHWRENHRWKTLPCSFCRDITTFGCQYGCELLLSLYLIPIAYVHIYSPIHTSKCFIYFGPLASISFVTMEEWKLIQTNFAASWCRCILLTTDMMDFNSGSSRVLLGSISLCGFLISSLSFSYILQPLIF